MQNVLRRQYRIVPGEGRAEGRFVVAQRRVEERRVLLCEPPAHTLQRFYSE